MSPPQRWLRKLAGAATSLAIYVVVLELLLQCVALAIAATGREVPTTFSRGHRRVLAVGDSNTYGVYLGRDQAYPQQLEAIWNRRFGEAPIEVLNLGFPGTNSSVLLRDFPAMLETLRPEVVILLVGANDYWTLPVDPAAAETGHRPSPLLGWLRASRSYQLFHILRQELSAPELEVRFSRSETARTAAGASCGEGVAWGDEWSLEDVNGCQGTLRYGDREFELKWQLAPSGFMPSEEEIVANLGALIEQVRRAGAKPVLLTYATGYSFYGYANALLRRAAEATGSELVDVRALFLPRCWKGGCPELIFPDGHPRAAGYRLIADAIVPKLEADLR